MVESSLQDGGTRFATGAFAFLQVCRRWNEVAIGFPQLWSLWVPGAVKAWPLFHSRSKDAPLFLTWRPPLLISTRDVLADPAIPSRIRRLDLSGNSKQLIQFFGAFGSSPSSNVSSIRLKVPPHDEHEPNGHFARFLSSSFPKLSQLHLENFIHNSSSPIYTTSGLTSLKLSLPRTGDNPLTPSRFSRILQQHPNIRELDFKNAIPLPGPSGASSVPIILPRLVNLRLDDKSAAILGLMDLIDMSSPLHDVAIRFGSTHIADDPRLVSVMKGILVPYYECRGLNHPRKVDHLTISYNSKRIYLVFNSRSRSTPGSNLRFRFDWVTETAQDIVVKDAFPLFPLDDVREFAVEGFVINKDGYRGMFRKMKNLSHLRLDELDLRPVLEALSACNHGMFRIVTKTTLVYLHVHRWATNNPQARVVDPISP